MKSKNNFYEYKEEDKSLEEVYQINNKEPITQTNEIEEIFEDMIVYS